MQRDLESEPLLNRTGRSNSGASSSTTTGSRWSVCQVLYKWKTFLVIIGILIWIYIGYAYARDFEGWSALTAIYVIVQIVTTVGYGDITVSTEQGKFFMAFYVIFTFLILGALATDYINTLLDKNKEVLQKQIAKVKKMKNNEQPSRFQEFLHHFQDLIVAFILFAIFVAFGTIFYGTYETCSCSYGVTKVKDCIDGVDAICAATGGYVKSWTDAFYMSVVTLTTVGFGDHAPRSDVGRAIGCVWMLFGVVATANFASAFGALLIAGQKHEHRIGKAADDIFQKMDTDKNGEIDRREFRTYALLKFGLVTNEELEEIDNLFDAIDTDGGGSLSYKELKAYCDTS